MPIECALISKSYMPNCFLMLSTALLTVSSIEFRLEFSYIFLNSFAGTCPGADSLPSSAAAKVIREGLHPIKLSSASGAVEYMTELQSVLKSSPPPWLAKVMGEKPEQRVRFNQEAAS